MAKKEKQKSNRLGYLILSIIIAIILWVFVTYATNMDITKRVHVTQIVYIGEDQLTENGLAVHSASTSAEMTIKLKGKRSEFIRQIDNIMAEVDVSELTEAGEYDLEGTVKARNLSTLDQTTVTVHVVAEETAHKTVPLLVSQTGLEKGTLIRSVPAVKNVEINGAKSDVEEVAAAYVTVDAEKSGAADVILPISLADSNGNAIAKDTTVHTDISAVEVQNTLYVETELPVKARLSELLESRYVLDDEKTEIYPQNVKIGVLPGSNFTFVEAEITSAEITEKECELIEEKGMYIPEDREIVKITPAFKATAEQK